MKEALSIKNQLISALLVLVMMFTSLIGTTFAWFTDEVTSSGNKIQSGNLQVDLSHLYKGEWLSLKENKDHKILNYDKWEPGYTLVDSLKVDNLGSLALKYRLSVEIDPGSAKDGKNGEKLSDVIEVYITYGDTAGDSYSAIKAESSGWTYKGTLTEVLSRPQDFITGQLLPTGGVVPTGAPAHTEVRTQVAKIALHMKESAGNEYQDLSVGDIYVSLLASQLDYENDSFGGGYDSGAEWPESPIGKNSIKAPIGALVDGKLAASMFMQSDDAKTSATFPEGVKADEGATEFVLNFDELAAGQANIALDENEEAIYLNVHVDGVAEDNEIPIAVYRKEVLPKGLNIGNYRLYHVEDGVTVQMTLRQDGATPVHNDFDYDPVTGDAIFYLKSFSEVALVADTENAWNGEFDYSWYDVDATELEIANADQLAAFGAIVGGMAKDKDGNFLITYTDSDGDEHHNDTFSGKTVKLIADINLGDKESENNPDIIFYPIGYWNNEGTYERKPLEERTTAVSSGFYSFEGTFDGNGNTISNFYQNTWEMKGDHNWYDPIKEQYYRDGMGLFGKVYGGTVKNLTIENFSSDGEITTTGVIAAYADSADSKPATFENIAILNCNPRVYNIGNGGIVGCAGWYSRSESLGNGEYSNAVTFKNITVDQTNKISALWGTYDVSCGGILGQYYPDSGCGIKLENCHVAAIMDVNNDVCANYQYYWYRYSGMFIGTIRSNTKDGGYTVADPTGITAKDCTYSYGSWNEYWYCELVKNSSASYTHDYQFGRLTNIDDISEIKSGETWLKEGNFALVSDDRKSVECYHIFRNSNGDLYRHFHDVADESNPEIYEDFDLNGDGELNDLKEDRQRYYLPFGQVFNGLGYGVKPTYTFDGFKLVEDGTVISGTKFNVKNDADLTYRPGDKIYLKDLVRLSVDISKLSQSSLYVAASPVNENETVSITYSRDNENWENNYFVISNDTTGAIKLVITDYFYCTATSIYLNPEEASEKFTANSVSEQNAYTQITLGTLFGVKDGATIGNVTATVTDPSGNATTVTGTSSDWTTKTVDLTNDGTWTVVIKDDDTYCAVTTVTFTVNKVDKFTANSVSAQDAYTQITLGELFGVKYGITIGNVTATVTDPNGDVTTVTGTSDDWTTKTIDLIKDGTWAVTIVDDACSKTSEVTFTVNKVDKFTKKFDKDFLYRVGNQNTVDVGTIFGEIETVVKLSSVNVTIENVAGNAAGTFTSNATWTNGKIQFTDTGVVTVRISADGANAVELNLEVVDAVNATGATSAKSNNVVLLNDAGFSSLEVSGGYTLYGNGFTLTCGSDSASLGFGQFVTLNNGTLDNIQIVCPNYDYAALYKSQLTGDDNRSQTTDSTRYYNAKSAVLATGNSQILNSRISGGRAALYASNGNVVVDNSRLEGGAVATVIISAANSFVFRDAALVQQPTESTYKKEGAEKGKTLMGMSVLYLCDADGNATPTTLEGDFVQYAWADESCAAYMPTGTNSIVTTVLGKSNYTHTINGKTCVNLGFAYMPNEGTTVSQPNNITDNREDKASIPYAYESVKADVPTDIAGITTNISTYVYSYQNTSGTADSFKTISNYTPNKYSDIVAVSYSDTTAGLTTGKSYGTDGWIYELNVDLDTASGYKVDFGKLSMSINGVTVTDYKVNGGDNPSPVAVTSGGVTYELTATIDDKEYKVSFKVIGTETSKESPSKISGPTTAGFGVAKSYGSDWSGAADVLTGVKIKYWSVDEKKYIEYDFSNFTVPGNAGKLNGTNSYWEYTHTNNDFTLKVTNTDAIHSGKSVYGMPILGEDGKLYFTISSTNGYVGSGTTSRAIAMKYEFTDNNGGETLTFTHTFNISYNKDEQYNYSDFCNGKLTKLTSCVTADTLITLADGTQKRIDQLTYSDELLVWDFYTGKLTIAPISIIYSHEEEIQSVLHLNFSDGTTVKVISSHGFFDTSVNNFVYISENNVTEFIGHSFVKINGDICEKVTLESYNVMDELTTAYWVQTAVHNNAVTEGMLSITTPDYEGWFDYFEITDDMKYDEEHMESEIEKYGLTTYEELAQYGTYEQYVAWNCKYFNILIGRGVVTMEDILWLLECYG